MAVAAYASLISLGKSLDSVQQLHDSGRIVIDKQQVHDFQHKVRILLQFIEDLPQPFSAEIGTPIEEIKALVAEAELRIDAEVVDQLNDSIQNPSVSSDAIYTGMALEGKVNRVIGELTSDEKSIQCVRIEETDIIKVTLAKHVLKNSMIRQRFDRFIWCTMFRNYGELDILQSLVQDRSSKENHELRKRLHQKLRGRRYLVVIDDTWSAVNWDQLKNFLPENHNNSRVIVIATTINYSMMFRFYSLKVNHQELCFMGVAAYVSLLSLEKSLDRFQKLQEKQHVHHIQEKVRVLLEIIEALPQPLGAKIETLTRDIMVVVINTELVIDAEIVEQLDGKTEALRKVSRKLEWFIKVMEFEVPLDSEFKVVKQLDGKSDGLSSFTQALHKVNRKLELFRDPFLEEFEVNENSDEFSFLTQALALVRRKLEWLIKVIELEVDPDQFLEIFKVAEHVDDRSDGFSMSSAIRALRRMIKKLEWLIRVVEYEVDPYLFHMEFKGVLAETEILINAVVVEQRGGKRDWLASLIHSLDTKTQEIELTGQLMKGEVVSRAYVRDSIQAPYVSFNVRSSEKSVVGLEKMVSWLKFKVTSHEKSLQFIPIVGMGGIGKTTLAEHIFNDPVIRRRFDTFLWCTISHNYNKRHILQSLLKSLLGVEDKSNEENRELGQRLYQNLYSRKYLIVVDDVLSIDPWNYLKLFLPDKNTNSRVIVTTRVSKVAESINSHNMCEMNLLDDESSWDLLHKEIFKGQQPCPDDELEEIGKNIAKKCKGLPLSLVTIGGLLSKSKMSLDYWEEVARNVNEMAGSQDCMNIISLSYKYLPIHLKPCFMYFRNCYEGELVELEEMLLRWICEGFIKSISGQHAEDVAKDYMKDLVDRNLIMRKIRHNAYGEVKEYCGIHDLLRELSFHESGKENFFLIPRTYYPHPTGRKCCMCGGAQASYEAMDISQALPSKALSHINLCKRCKIAYPLLGKSKFVSFSKAGQHVQYVNTTTQRLARVEVEYTKDELVFPLPIHYFWSLEVLFIKYHETLILPEEIWGMQQLRHLILQDVILPETQAKSSVRLEQLQTLQTNRQRLGKDIFQRIPNVKNLQIAGTLSDDDSFAGFHQLEVLRTSITRGCDLTSILPRSLKKLTLTTSLKSPAHTLTLTLGSLPNLESLQLSSDDVKDECIIRGQFPRLKVMTLRSEFASFRSIEIESDQPPDLEKLVLSNMKTLSIPSSIADLATQLSILLFKCDDFTIESAKELLKEQCSYGNNALKLYVDERVVEVSDFDDRSSEDEVEKKETDEEQEQSDEIDEGQSEA